MIPTFSRREIEDLEPSIRSYSSETLIIDPFYLYRMYTTDLFGPLPELESNYRQERSFITNRSLLTFPRQVPIRVTIFVPAPRELYTGKLPGYNNVNGVCLSGNDSELFVYWGVWDMTLDDTFQVTKEQLKLMPPMIRGPILAFFMFYGPHDTMRCLEKHFVRYTMKWVPIKGSLQLSMAMLL